jgi:hypothetical protein
MARHSRASNDPASLRLAWDANHPHLTKMALYDAPAYPTTLTADELFIALDGRSVTVAGRTWRLAIYSIYDQQASRWIQLQLNGRPKHIMTLRVATDASVEAVVETLSESLDGTSPTRAVHDVTSVH